MPNLCDCIEAYIRDLLQEREGVVEIRRSELAERFGCAPSQINYVLSTRFTPDRGYVVESRRGGGGYIRITRLNLEREDLFGWLSRRLAGPISQDEACHIIARLQEDGIVTPREALLMQAAVHRETIALDLPLRDQVRARLLHAMLIALLRA